MNILTTGTIEILDDSGNTLETYVLENTRDIKGHVMLYSQIDKGYYAKEDNGQLFVEEMTPNVSPTGINIVTETLVAHTRNWRRREA